MFFQSQIGEVSFRVGDYDQIHLFALVADLERCLFIELWQFGPRTRYANAYFAMVRSDFLSLSGEAL